MSRTQVTFNDVDLTDLFVVSDLKVALLPRNIKTIDVDGRDGSIFGGVEHSSRTITMTLTVRNSSIEGRQQASRLLASILAVDEPKPLAISIDDGLYYMAIPTSDGDGARYRNANVYDVSFECPDPIAYGEEKTVTVPSGGSVTFMVGGTYPTMPTVNAPSAANGSGGFWRLRLEDGSYLMATIPSGLNSAPVIADCAKRILMVNSSVALLVPEADWLVLEPGEHTLTMTGTGAATIRYIERWV